AVGSMRTTETGRRTLGRWKALWRRARHFGLSERARRFHGLLRWLHHRGRSSRMGARRAKADVVVPCGRAARSARSASVPGTRADVLVFRPATPPHASPVRRVSREARQECSNMTRLISILLALAVLSCTATPPPVDPLPPPAERWSSLILGPTLYCGATRTGPTEATTARHCISDGLCGTATDRRGNTVSCEAARLEEDRDVGRIHIDPDSSAAVVEIGRFMPGVAVLVSHIPAPFSEQRIMAYDYHDLEIEGTPLTGLIAW